MYTDLRDCFDDNIQLSTDWLNNVEEYELKILILTSVLAQNNLGYRGTLKTMCEWLGIKSCTLNNRSIKQALDNLENDGYIFHTVEGRTHHISISNKGFKDKRTYRIRRLWINVLKHYNRDSENNKIDKSFSIDWIKLLKVFLWIYYVKEGKIFTLSEMAKKLDMSKESASKAIKALMECDFKGIKLYKSIEKEKYKNGDGEIEYKTIGTLIDVCMNFEDVNIELGKEICRKKQQEEKYKKVGIL